MNINTKQTSSYLAHNVSFPSSNTIEYGFFFNNFQGSHRRNGQKGSFGKGNSNSIGHNIFDNDRGVRIIYNLYVKCVVE